MQNGYVQSFNGRLRDEPLNESLFFDLDHARSGRSRLSIDAGTDPTATAALVLRCAAIRWQKRMLQITVRVEPLLPRQVDAVLRNP
ncbi:hypothetical protein J2W42_005806 [Rhizobium tibeticum]|nr:hypothetical protein [Rhizobium tibeticum]